MTAFLLIVIAVILFFIAKSLHNKADEIEGKNQSYSHSTPQNITVQTPPVQKLSYWEKWKKDNPQKAKVIESCVDKKLSDCTDRDAKEIVDAFTRMAHANNISDWNEIKPFMLYKLTKMVDDLGETQAFSILENAIQEEIAHTQALRNNTGTYIAFSWLKQAMDNAKKEGKPFSNASKRAEKCSYLSSLSESPKDYSDEEKNQIVEQFRKEYISHLMSAIGDNINIPFFCEGYDSPVAREIMLVMYSYLRNDSLISKAKQEGLWKKFFFLIVKETNKITDKYCDADVQECIEYFNFPDKPVKTSRRCPTCHSRNVFCEDIGQYECMDCGATWFAMHGRDTYSEL